MRKSKSKRPTAQDLRVIRACAGDGAEVPCRPLGRWFRIEGDPRLGLDPIVVCEAHVGWGLATMGLPARVDPS